jgi:hypothetical protein
MIKESNALCKRMLQCGCCSQLMENEIVGLCVTHKQRVIGWHHKQGNIVFILVICPKIVQTVNSAFGTINEHKN